MGLTVRHRRGTKHAGRKQPRRRRGAGSSGDLLELVSLTQDGLGVLADGTLLRVLDVQVVNPLVMDPERVEQLAKQLHAVNTRVPAGQTLQFYVQSSPIGLRELVEREQDYAERAAAAYDRAARPGGAEAARRHSFAQTHSLLTHVPSMSATELRFAVVCPWRPARPVIPRLRRSTDEVREIDADALEREIERVDRYADDIARALRAADLASRRLRGPELLDMLWSRFSPNRADAGELPPSVTAPSACGSLHAASSHGEARILAGCLRESVCEEPISFTGPTTTSIGPDGDGDQLTGAVSAEQTFRVATVPEQTWLGWVMYLMQAPIPWTLSIHIHGTDRHRERGRQRRRYRRLYGVNRGSELRGKLVDPEQREREQEAGEVNDALAAHAGSTVQNVSMYVSLRDADSTTLAELQRRVADEGEALGNELTSATDAHLDPCRFAQAPAWRSTLPLGRDELRRTRRYLSLNVADSLPLVSTGCGSPPSPTWIPVGFSSIGRTLEGLDPFDPSHPNHVWLVTGQGGGGKTMLVNILLSRSIAKGATGVVIERGGHYSTLALGNPDAVVLQLGAGGEAMNPWDGEPDDDKVAFLLALHDLLIGEQAGLGDESALGVRQRSLLTLAIQGVYRRCRLSGEVPREQILQEELHKRYVAARADGSGNLAGDYQTLELAISNYVADGPYAWLVDRPTTTVADPALQIWDTSHIPDSVSPAALFVICEATIRRIEAKRAEFLAGRRDGRPWDGKFFLWIDEMWKLYERRSTGRHAKEWALRSRHKATWFGAISQRLDHSSTPEGRDVVSQASVKIFLRTTPDQLPYIQETVGLSDEETRAIGALTTAKREYSTAFVMNGTRGRGTVTVSVSDLEYWLATSDPVNDEPVRRDALHEAGGNIWSALKLLADPEWHAARRAREHEASV